MKDRKPRYPNRVLITPENGGEPFYATMTRADEPYDEGMAMSKQNILQDATAAAIGLDPEADPTPNDAFLKLDGNYRRRYKVGDIATSVRTDLGEKWALCNGDPVYRDAENTNFELYKLLDPGIDPRTINLVRPGSVGLFTDMGNGMWCNFRRDNNTCFVMEPLTGNFTYIDFLADNYEVWILGVVWDGSRYVLCCINSYANNPSLRFYTSNDLKTWTLAAEHTPAQAPGAGAEHGTPRFLWDGAAYRVACQYYGYQAHYLHTYAADFSYVGSVNISYCDVYAAQGLFVAGGDVIGEEGCDFFEPGSIEKIHSLSIRGNDAYAALVFERYTGSKYVAIPLGSNFQTRLTFYDKSTNTFSKIEVPDIDAEMHSMVRVHIDRSTGELLFVLRPSEITTGAVLKLARVKFGANLTAPASYDVSVYDVFDSGTVTSLRSLSMIDGELSYLTDAYSSATVAGPHPRRLPVVTHDECYTYIKIEEGE